MPMAVILPDMARKSAALTKEQRSLKSSGRSEGRKKAEEKASTARLIVGGASLVGAALAGALDKRAIDKDGAPASFKFLGMKVPTNAAVGLGGAAAGYLLGKGEVAAGVFGGGLGAANASVYRMVVDRDTDDAD